MVQGNAKRVVGKIVSFLYYTARSGVHDLSEFNDRTLN